MYQPEKYTRNDRSFIFRFIQAHPFAILVLSGDRLLATHIPVLTEGDADDFILFGHVANHNPIQSRIEEGTKALLIFQGPDTYISSSWYEEVDVSTWNYSAVHVNGRMEVQDRDALEDSLKQLVRRFESGEESPVLYDDIPRDMLSEQLDRITGFIVHPEIFRGVHKWSQDKSDRERNTILIELEKKGFDPVLLEEYLGNE